MPNRKKFNARFPPARIKKIMRTDKEVGKVAAPVPAVISRALELFAEQLLQKAGQVTLSRGSRTLSTAHLKHCILSERRFDFLKELVEDIPDAGESEEAAGSSSAAPATATSATSRPVQPPPPPTEPVASAAPRAPRSYGRPPKYLKMEIPASVAPTANGQPHSAPPGRPPVPGLIHTSLLGLTGGAVTASAVSGQQFTFAAPSLLVGAAPPPAHRGPAGRQPPPLAVSYGTLADAERPDGV